MSLFNQLIQLSATVALETRVIGTDPVVCSAQTLSQSSKSVHEKSFQKDEMRLQHLFP